MCNRHPRNGSKSVQAVDWSPDGQRLASGSGDKTIRIFDVEKGTCEKVLKGHR